MHMFVVIAVRNVFHHSPSDVYLKNIDAPPINTTRSPLLIRHAPWRPRFAADATIPMRSFLCYGRTEDDVFSSLFCITIGLHAASWKQEGGQRHTCVVSRGLDPTSIPRCTVVGIRQGESFHGSVCTTYCAVRGHKLKVDRTHPPPVRSASTM